MPNPVGRPPKYKTAKELQKKIDEYFLKCDEGELIEVYSKKKQEVVKIMQKTPYTVPGLSDHLGFASRQSFLDYEKKGKKEGVKDGRFTCTITRARQRIERQRNERALSGEQESRFAQFDLKENFGWKDQQNVKQELVLPPGLMVKFGTKKD